MNRMTFDEIAARLIAQRDGISIEEARQRRSAWKAETEAKELAEFKAFCSAYPCVIDATDFQMWTTDYGFDPCMSELAAGVNEWIEDNIVHGCSVHFSGIHAYFGFNDSAEAALFKFRWS